MTEIICKDEQELRKLSNKILAKHGVDKNHLQMVTDVLIEADLRGHTSHGIRRLLKWTVGLKSGAIGCTDKMVERQVSPGVTWYEGNRTLGPISANKAIERCMEQAQIIGISLVSVRGASHIGMLGYYAEQAALKGFIGIIMTNTEPAVAPYGGLSKVLGTNPIAIGIPRNKDNPILIDMSTSVVARGKIVEALSQGKSIEKGWALDSDGNPTQDPEAALAGTLLPIGGVKGYALGLMVEVMTGALAGAAVGSKVTGTYDMSTPPCKGDLYLCIDPARAAGNNLFSELVEQITSDIKNCRSINDCDILLPGEPEYRERMKRMNEGIPVELKVYESLCSLA